MPSPIEVSLRRFSGEQRAALETTIARLRELLPTATDAISWGMPTLKVDGVAIIAVEGFTHHNSLFPMSGSLPRLLATQLAGYQVSKGTIQFSKHKPMPKALLRAIVKAKIAEVNSGYPKKNGEVKEFYDNGVLKATGRMKDGTLTGAWKWYRRDGSLMRSGTFVSGAQSGEWVTYAADGGVVKRTQFTRRPATRAAAVKR